MGRSARAVVWVKPPSDTYLKPVIRCGLCKRDHDKQESADACCVCERCKKAPVRILDKISRFPQRDKMCERCRIVERIGDQRRRVEALEESVAAAKASLSALEEAKARVEAGGEW